MERELIKIEHEGYVLEETKLNKELIFYKNDNGKIDINIFNLLYYKFIWEKILLRDQTISNNLIFDYLDDYVKITLISFRKEKKLINSPSKIIQLS